MLINPASSLPSTPQPLFIWVLAPYLQTNDANIDYYYDFSQSIEEYTSVFAQLQLNWKWQPVTQENVKQVIDDIAATTSFQTPIVLNLCDGDEVNGTPGVSVIHYLKEKQLIYTGADAPFYDNTTSKIVMKELFDKAGIHLDGNKEFVIETVNNAPDNGYVQCVTLNGKKYTKSYLLHKDIEAGGILKVVMGDTPNYDFGTLPEDRP